MDKKLYRSNKDKIIAGVCAGLAEYFDLDVTLVRIIFVVIVLAGGAGVLAYVILWIVVPQNPGEGEAVKAGSKEAVNQFASEVKGKAEEIKEAFSKDEKKEEECCTPEEKKRIERRAWPAIILLVIGVFFLAANFTTWLNWGKLWPVILILMALVMLFRRRS
ncbi:MAG: PspC domain-containing protein [Patescibacteria group bacterium]